MGWQRFSGRSRGGTALRLALVVALAMGLAFVDVTAVMLAPSAARGSSIPAMIVQPPADGQVTAGHGQAHPARPRRAAPGGAADHAGLSDGWLAAVALLALAGSGMLLRGQRRRERGSRR